MVQSGIFFKTQCRHNRSSICERRLHVLQVRIAEQTKGNRTIVSLRVLNQFVTSFFKACHNVTDCVGLQRNGAFHNKSRSFTTLHNIHGKVTKYRSSTNGTYSSLRLEQSGFTRVRNIFISYLFLILIWLHKVCLTIQEGIV